VITKSLVVATPLALFSFALMTTGGGLAGRQGRAEPAEIEPEGEPPKNRHIDGHGSQNSG
jgi:hypothetical protein